MDRARARALREDILATLEGCQDSYCSIRGKAVGMHTNGGCQCVRGLVESMLDLAVELEPYQRRQLRPALLEDTPNGETGGEG